MAERDRLDADVNVEETVSITSRESEKNALCSKIIFRRQDRWRETKPRLGLARWSTGHSRLWIYIKRRTPSISLCSQKNTRFSEIPNCPQPAPQPLRSLLGLVSAII